MQKLTLSLICLVFSCALPLAYAADDTAEALLHSSDRARGGVQDGISWTVDVKTHEDDENHESQYLVKAKTTDAIAECTAPARSKGQILLFNDRNLWMYKPGLKKPVSISPRQRLSGQAANGDIAATHYARDYTSSILKEETLNGVETYVLLLKAKSSQVTYDQIRYWISKKQKLAIRAEFLTLQGTLFKVAEFEYQNTLDTPEGPVPFVSLMKISDATFKENITTLKYTKPVHVKHSSSIFNVNNLVR